MFKESNSFLNFIENRINPEVDINLLIFVKYSPKYNEIVKNEYFGKISQNQLIKEMLGCDFCLSQIIEAIDDYKYLRLKTTFINGELVSKEEGAKNSEKIIEQLGFLSYDENQEFYIKARSGFIYPFDEGNTNIIFKKNA